MQKSSNTMVPIDNFKDSVSLKDNDRFRDGSCIDDEICTCSKPLRGAFQICNYCMRSFLVLLDKRTKNELGWETEWHGEKISLREFPSREMPEGNREPS